MLSLPTHRLATRIQSPERVARRAGFRRIAGVDEAGRGPWAGPVVACAVVLPPWRPSVRIDDSKRLTPLQRARACDVILRVADVGLGIVCAQDVDRLNVLQATLLAMREAVSRLRHRPDVALIDGNVAPSLEMPAWTFVRGDQRSRSIACASIVAKVVRDRLMTFYDRVYPEYEFSRHKGYGTARHAAALGRWGVSPLHRLSVEPVAARLARVSG